MMHSTHLVGTRRPVVDQARLRAARSIRRSSAGDAEATPANMTLDEAYDLLGVKESASFDDILVAKNQQIRKHEGDRDRIIRVGASGAMVVAGCA